MFKGTAFWGYMKVIFLDFDGVLNSAQYDRERDWTKNTNIDETRMPLLKEIVDATQAKIVLTTTWRTHWNKNPNDCDEVGVWMNDLFARYGLGIYGKTPQLRFGATRKEEVLSWLEFPPEEIESFVILDDYGFGWGELSAYFVKTSPRLGRGLEQSHVLQAIEILNGGIIP